ncbi:MAG: hypothetical protein JXO22_04565 [Phycisphaerae bacterium]|nr:hypothetical protein [Phycisphaerae bacterium]
MGKGKSRKSSTVGGEQPAPPTDTPWLTGPRMLWLTAIALGIIIRIVTVLMSPLNGYLQDHVSHMGRFKYAFEHGPWQVYEMPNLEPFVRPSTNPGSGAQYEIVANPHVVNYPPLSAYLFWLQGAVWHVLDPEVVTVAVTMRDGSRGEISSPLIETRAARFADGFVAMILDFFVAWGVARVVRELSRKRQPLRESIAFAITILAPPVFLDSAFWIQFESWVMCLLIWCLVLLLRGRLVWAGIIYGVALMTKTQSIIFGPVFVYVFFARWLMADGNWRRALAMWKTGVAAVLTVAFIAAPFMLNDARDAENTEGGAWRWFKRAYTGTIGDERYDRITLHAYNIWWLDLASQGPPPDDPGERAAFRDRIYSNDTPLFGIPKGRLGTGLLALSVLATWALCAHKWRWRRESWVVCTYMILFAAFMLPTTVHERYIYYCIPPAIALAVHRRAWIAPLVVLLIVGTSEMFSYRLPSITRYSDAASDVARARTSFLAVLAVLAFIYSYVVVIMKSRPKSKTEG